MAIQAISQHTSLTSTSLDDMRPERITRPQAVTAVDVPRTAPEPMAIVGPDAVAEDGDNKAPAATPARGRGVLRLLEAGHFRGVSDVRLRINFNEELTQRAADRVQPILQEYSERLISGVSDELNNLLSNLAVDASQQDVVEGLVADFKATVEAAVVTSAEAGPVDSEELEQVLRSAFESLVDSLNELFTAPEVPTEPPGTTTSPQRENDPDRFTGREGRDPITEPEAFDAERFSSLNVVPLDDVADSSDFVSSEGVEAIDAAPVSGTIEPTEADVVPVEDTGTEDAALSIDDAITILRSAFEELLASLTFSLDSASTLPELTEPSGSGQAYDKFLTTYQLLLDGASALDEQG